MSTSFTRAGRILAAVSLAFTAVGVSAPAVSADVTPATYPGVAYADVPKTSITDNGWTLCWSGNYNESDAISNFTEACTSDYLVLAGGFADADTFTVAAAGPRSAVVTVTAYNETTLGNGTYWYYNGDSMGFSPTSVIMQDSADGYDTGYNWGGFDEGLPTNAWRLSWHTDGSETPTYISSGWRAGVDNGNNEDHGIYAGNYMRYVYQASAVTAGSWVGGTPYTGGVVAPQPPTLVVDALNVNVAMGEVVPASVRVLGLKGTDAVSDVVLEYEGHNIWGEHYGPSTTAPTLAGTYSISVKSYKLTAADASIYFQSRHGAELVIRWKQLPITDPKLVAPAVNADGSTPVVYGDNGASQSGASWSLNVTGAPRASVGGFLITDGGTVLKVTGTGYRPWSPVRLYFMSDPVELGSVYTDASGAFTTSVTVPSVTGNHTLQVNGYSVANLVRSSSVAMFVGTTRSLSEKFLFAKNSSELSSDAVAKVAKMMNSIPVKPWRIHITITTSALALTGPNARTTQARVDNIEARLAATLKAAGVDVVVESTIWYQPGLAPRWEKQARWVHVDLNW